MGMRDKVALIGVNIHRTFGKVTARDARKGHLQSLDHLRLRIARGTRTFLREVLAGGRLVPQEVVAPGVIRMLRPTEA